jgi:hypothetical protein
MVNGYHWGFVNGCVGLGVRVRNSILLVFVETRSYRVWLQLTWSNKIVVTFPDVQINLEANEWNSQCFSHVQIDLEAQGGPYECQKLARCYIHPTQYHLFFSIHGVKNVCSICNLFGEMLDVNFLDSVFVNREVPLFSSYYFRSRLQILSLILVAFKFT